MFILNTKTRKKLFELHGNALKKMKLASTEDSKEKKKRVTEATYVAALEISKQIKRHTIGENLIKNCSLKMVEIVLVNEMKTKIAIVHCQTVLFRGG